MLNRVIKNLKIARLQNKLLNAHQINFYSYAWKVTVIDGNDFVVLSNYSVQTSKSVLKTMINEKGLFNLNTFVPLSNIKKIELLDAETQVFSLYTFDEYDGYYYDFTTLERLEKINKEHQKIKEELAELERD